MPKKKSLSSEEALNKLCKQGWLVWLKSDFLNCRPAHIQGTRTIEIDPPESKKPRLFIYNPEKVAAQIVSWQKPNTKENVVALQKLNGWTLVHVFQKERKGIFINENIIPILDSTNIHTPACY